MAPEEPALTAVSRPVSGSKVCVVTARLPACWVSRCSSASRVLAVGGSDQPDCCVGYGAPVTVFPSFAAADVVIIGGSGSTVWSYP
jgi:hypothetical protein